jgi:hypothetical protein
MTKRDDMPVSEIALKRAISAALTEGVMDARRSTKRALIEAARSDGRWTPHRRLSQRAAAAFTVVTLVASGASVAVAGGRPGSPAYALKRAAERMALEVVPDGALEDALQARFAERRAAEIRELLRSGMDEEALRRALTSTGIASPSPGHGGQESAADALRRELRRIEGGSTEGPATGGAESGAGAGESPSSQGSGSRGGAPATGDDARDGSHESGTGGGAGSQPSTPSPGPGPGGSPNGAGDGAASPGSSRETTGGPGPQGGGSGAGDGQRRG